MSGALADLLQFSFVALTSIFSLVDPIAAVPTFLIITANAGAEHRRQMARRAAWTCFAVLCGFAMAGALIFKLFGITLPAFKIAGGLILLLIGMDMVQARRSQTKETPTETEEGVEKEDAGIIPLGVPMLAGPGSISTVMVLMGGAPVWWYARRSPFSSCSTDLRTSGWLNVGRRKAENSQRLAIQSIPSGPLPVEIWP